MFGIRILSALTAYSVLLLEVYSGALQGPLWWVAPGVLVISLLMALSSYTMAPQQSRDNGEPSLNLSPAKWAMIVVSATAMVGFANYMGRAILPDIIMRSAAAA